MKNLRKNDPILWVIIDAYARMGKGKKLQKAAVTLGQNISVDGAIGPGTIRALSQVNLQDLARVLAGTYKVKMEEAQHELQELDTETETETEEGSAKKKVMDYLAKYEAGAGHVHFNKGEKDITSSYGIYKHSFPNAHIFKWYEAIARANGIGTNFRMKANRDALNRLIRSNAELIAEERELAWQFYLKNFMNPKVIKYLNGKEALTFFSLSVNGGKGRGAKALQSAIGVGVDGAIGPGTLRALKAAKAAGKNLNDGMLDYMQRFYDRLIRKNPGKYKRFKNGWHNRLQGLR